MPGHRAAEIDRRAGALLDPPGHVLEPNRRLIFVDAAPGLRLHLERCRAHAPGVRLEESHQVRNFVQIAVMDRGIEHDRQRKSLHAVEIFGAQRVQFDFAAVSLQLLGGVDVKRDIHEARGGELFEQAAGGSAAIGHQGGAQTPFAHAPDDGEQLVAPPQRRFPAGDLHV